MLSIYYRTNTLPAKYAKLSKYTEHQKKLITSFKEHYVLKLITSKLIIFEYKQAIVLLIKHI